VWPDIASIHTDLSLLLVIVMASCWSLLWHGPILPWYLCQVLVGYACNKECVYPELNHLLPFLSVPHFSSSASPLSFPSNPNLCLLSPPSPSVPHPCIFSPLLSHLHPPLKHLQLVQIWNCSVMQRLGLDRVHSASCMEKNQLLWVDLSG